MTDHESALRDHATQVVGAVDALMTCMDDRDAAIRAALGDGWDVEAVSDATGMSPGQVWLVGRGDRVSPPTLDRVLRS